MIKKDNKKLFICIWKGCILKQGLITALTGLTIHLYFKYVENWDSFRLKDNIAAFMIFLL